MLVRSLSILLPFAAAGLVAQNLVPPADTASALSAKQRTTVLSRPLSFTPNRGQSAHGVDFTANGSGYSMALAGGSAVLSLTPGAPRAGGHKAPAAGEMVQMQLAGGNTGATVAPEQILPGKANYIIGNDRSKWRTDVPTYGRVKYAAVYPGVDLAYYGTQQQLEYDFLVAPHSDVSSIALRFEGAKSKVQPDGDLLLTVPSGRTVSFQKPVVYQVNTAGARESVAGSYALARDGSVGFTVGAYDHSRQLVIDPVLSYASFLGDNNYSDITGAAVSPQGYLYLTGYTYDYNSSGIVPFPTTPGAFQPNCNSCQYSTKTAFVTKFSADGKSLIYSTYLEGAYDPNTDVESEGYAIAVSPADQAYVFGTTYNVDFPLANALQGLCRNDKNGCPGSFFVTRLNSAGNGLIYSTFFGQGSGGYVASISLDEYGNIILSGEAYMADPGPYGLPVTKNAYQTTYTEPYAAPFVTELSASGQAIIYSTLLTGNTFCGEGNGTCQPYAGHAVGRGGLIYVTGSTEAGDLPTTSNAFQPVCHLNTSGEAQCNEINGYLAIFDPSATTGAASAKTVTYIHGPTSGSDVYLSEIKLDPSGNIYLGGDSQDHAWPVTYANGLTYNTDVNCVNLVAKMNSTGSTLISSTYLGSCAGENQPVYLAFDQSGNLYSAFGNGNAPSGGTIPLVNPVQSTDYDQDVQIAEQTNDLSTILFSTYAGGSYALYPAGLSLDAARNIYLGSNTSYQGSDFITTPGAFQTSFPGGEVQGVVEKIGGLYATSATAISLSPGVPLIDQDVAITVDVTGSTKTTPTGSVSIYGDGAYKGAEPISSGKVTFTEAADTLGSGTHTVEMIYSGDSIYGGSLASVTYSLPLLTTQSKLSVSPPSVTVGGTVTAKVTVTRTQTSGTPTGNVEFFVDGGFLESTPLTDGTAEISASTAGQQKGTYTVTAIYQGDSVDAVSTSNAVQLTLK